MVPKQGEERDASRGEMASGLKTMDPVYNAVAQQRFLLATNFL